MAYEIYLNMKKYPEAMRVALRLSCIATIERTLVKCKDKLEKRQLAFMLARQVRLGTKLESPTHAPMNAFILLQWRRVHAH